MNSLLFKKCYLQTMCLQNIYNMYKEDLALNNIQGLIGHKTQPNQIQKSLMNNNIFLKTNPLF